MVSRPAALTQWIRSVAGTALDRVRDAGPRGVEEVQSGPAAGVRLDGRAPNAMVHGNYEMTVQLCLQETLSPGDVVFDVGANEGFFTLLAGRLVEPGGFVVAFEPSPRNLRRLRSNLRLNSLDCVQVLPVAASDRTGRDTLLITRYGGGPTLMSAGEVPPDFIRRKRVGTVRIDDLVGKTLPLPDVVKIDVEGAEGLVLDGMNRTLSRRETTVLVEVDGPNDGSHRRKWESVDTQLRAIGYRVEHLDPAYVSGGAWAVGHTLARPTKRR